MLRTDLQALARTRLSEARLLLRGGHASGAYYLIGMSVECAIKACIAKKTPRYQFPDKKFAAQCYEHNLEKLIGVAGLEAARTAERGVDATFDINWSLLKDWDNESRYDSSTTIKQARDLYAAVASPKHGVLRWLRQYW